MNCEDCGCRLNRGICSNCHEELHILEFQGDHIDFDLSDGFIEKATEQNIKVQENKKRRVKDKALSRQEDP